MVLWHSHRTHKSGNWWIPWQRPPDFLTLNTGETRSYRPLIRFYGTRRQLAGDVFHHRGGYLVRCGSSDLVSEPVFAGY
jgi:hypothetical protein